MQDSGNQEQKPIEIKFLILFILLLDVTILAIIIIRLQNFWQLFFSYISSFIYLSIYFSILASISPPPSQLVAISVTCYPNFPLGSSIPYIPFKRYTFNYYIFFSLLHIDGF